jgi:hypothetical protein
MLFEEFFKKKKINLPALSKADAGLFSEFKEHYAQMGEKSFDHTKKFNKLRRQFPLPPEVKAEKLRPENQIAEQTVADTLTEPSPREKAPELETLPANNPQTNNLQASNTNLPVIETPKLGFKPKFKQAAPLASAPAEPATENTEAIANENPAATPPKVGFKPRFKAGVTQNKPAEEVIPSKTTEEQALPAAEDNTAATPPPKVGFKPRFKAGVTNNKPVEEVTPAEQAQTPANDNPASNTAPKIGFKPRFKAGVTSAKPADEVEEVTVPQPEQAKEPTKESLGAEAEQSVPAKPGFKPRFKAGVTTTKPAGEAAPAPEPKPASETPEEPATTTSADNVENPTPKPAYKPRFTPNMIKRKPPEEDQ